MDAKTQAKTLRDEFYLAVGNIYDKTTEVDSFIEQNERAKKCALVCTNKIVEFLKITTGHCELRTLDYQEVQKDLQYLNDVKAEIEKL